MAPLTRSRAREDGVPTALMTDCYEQAGFDIGNNGYDRRLALQARRQNLLDLVSFGRLYIANPDLVERLRTHAALSEADPTTFFVGGCRGYTDFPSLDAQPGGTGASLAMKVQPAMRCREIPG
jgi:2,4-dienoyl-CoA reductase-like NADH-dependent reductase (Old Yellow Enzyme family)